jgi:hypothetical protein
MPGVLPNGWGSTATLSPTTAMQGVAGGNLFVPTQGTLNTGALQNPQFFRLYSGLNVAMPNAGSMINHATTATPVTTLSTPVRGFNSNGLGVQPSNGKPVFGTGPVTGAPAPGTVPPGYNSNGQGVRPNGGTAMPATSPFFPTSPGTVGSSASGNAQFNRLFSGLGAAMPADTAPAQTGPVSPAPTYNGNGPGVVPNGGRGR